MNQTTRTVALRRRSDDTLGQTFDVTGWSARNFEKLWDGLVRKVNFEEWGPVYSPPRGDDETIEQWLA